MKTSPTVTAALEAYQALADGRTISYTVNFGVVVTLTKVEPKQWAFRYPAGNMVFLRRSAEESILAALTQRRSNGSRRKLEFSPPVPSTSTRRVYKYPLSVVQRQCITLPKGAQILRVDNVEGFHLWALVDPEAETELRCIEMFKTGQEVAGRNLHYLGTCKIEIGQELCLYVFEVCTENHH